MDYMVEILRDMAESLAKLADETIDSPNTKTDALRSMSESLDELANGGGGGAPWGQRARFYTLIKEIKL